MNTVDQILPLSKVLMSVPSVKGDAKSIDLALEIAYQELYGYPFKKYKSNEVPSLLYYNSENTSLPFKIIFNANVDVLPGNENNFKPYEKDGKLYGRGVGMKTAAAAMILLFRNIANQVKYPLALQIVTDLQSGGFDGTKYQIDQGVKAEFVITTASTKFQIANESKGALWIKVHVKGEKAPGPDLWLGKNALWKLKEFLNKLDHAYPVPKENIWVTTVNVGKIETTNELVNVVPSDATALLDIRYIPEEKDTILEKIKSFLSEDCKLEIINHAPPEFTSKDNPYITKLTQSIEKVTEHQAQFMKKNFSNDIKHYNEVGIGGVAFGPLTGGNWADEEWVDIKSLEKYYQTLKEFLLHI